MTQVEISLCASLLQEYFGDSVQSVAMHLLKKFGPQTLPAICKDLKMNPKDVKLALNSLVYQNVAQFDFNKHGIAEFTVKCDNVLPYVFFPRSIVYIEGKLGNATALMFKEIWNSAIITMSETIKNISKRHYEQTGRFYTFEELAEFRDSFIELARHNFIRRCVKSTIPMSKREEINKALLFEVPGISLADLQRNIQSSIISEKERGVEETRYETKYGDKDIFWKADMDKLFIVLRHSIVIDAAKNSIGQKASNIVKVIYELSDSFLDESALWSSASPTVTFNEIAFQMKKLHSMEEKEVRSYIVVLCDIGDHCFLTKVDDRNAGTYVVNTKQIISTLAREVTVKFILEKMGSNYCRIYRLILGEKFIDPKNLEKKSMMSPKDVKFFTYTLIQESFVRIMGIPKTPDYAPNRMNYFYHVDLYSVCQMLLKLTYKTIMNVMVYSDLFKNKYSRVLEKKAKIEGIIENLKRSGGTQEQIEEVSKVITPPEVESLNKVMNSCNEMEISISHSVETVIILKSYLRYPSKDD